MDRQPIISEQPHPITVMHTSVVSQQCAAIPGAAMAGYALQRDTPAIFSPRNGKSHTQNQGSVTRHPQIAPPGCFPFPTSATLACGLMHQHSYAGGQMQTTGAAAAATFTEVPKV